MTPPSRIGLSMVIGFLLWTAGCLRGGETNGVVAGAGDYIVTSWHIQDGLPSDRVRAVLQTSDGYIWVATFNGLARFDGVRFQHFNDANTPGLRNSLANALFEDSAGRLWVGSDTGEIAWRDAAGFHSLVTPTNWLSGPVDRFVQAAGGDIYAVNRRGLVLRFRDCKSLEVLRPPFRYSDMAADLQHQVWAAQIGGAMIRLAPEGGTDGPPTTDLGYRDLAGARHGGIWVRDGNRLRRWADGKWMENRGAHSWTTQRPVNLYEDEAGHVWVGTVDDGVFIVAPDGSEQHINRAHGLGNDLVSGITSDREQNIWIATDGGGLELIRHRLLSMISPPDHWQNRAVLSVSPAQDGGLWVGTEGAGVYKWTGGQFQNIKGPANVDASRVPTAHDIRSVLEDSTGKLWVGTQGAGLLRMNPHGELFRVVKSPALPSTLELFYALYEDRSGAIWLGTQDGLVRYQDGDWSRLGRKLYRGEIRCICQTPDGAIWSGMRGGGVARYQSNTFTQYLHPQGLSYEYIWCLFADPDGTVWMGTPGAGLIRWRDGAFANFTTREGLPSDFICNIQEDKLGNLWIGSYAGIFRMAKHSLEEAGGGSGEPPDYILLDTSDGLGSLEIAGGNQPSACATADGRLWYATSGGLAVVDPARIQPNRLPPPVVIEAALIDGKPAAFQAPSSGDESPAGVVVPPGGGSVEFRYTALSYSPPQRCRFRYRLEELDSQWIEAGTRRTANYSRVPPNHYRFHVIACNGDGVWNTTGAVISFTVLPHFWEHWWFSPLCWLSGLSLAAAIALTMVRQRHRQRMEALRRARLVEQERLRIARDLHDDLGGRLTEISMTSALAEDPALSMPEARQYFHEISGRSVEMVNALDAIVWAVNPEHDDLDSLVTYFCQYASRFLRTTALSVRFQIPEQLPELPLDAERRHNLFLAYKEGLHNAVKHSDGSTLRVRVAVESHALRMAVEDDGKGFAEEDGPEPGEGLRNMRQRLRQIGGSCEITSAPGRGTRVVFILPL